MSARHSLPSPAACGLTACVLCLMALPLFTAGTTARQQPTDEQATEIFKTTCVKCHPADRILSARKTRTQWEETLEKMSKLGATATDEEFETVLDYLLRHCGRVNVNKAVAPDIALVLGLPSAEAESIVTYRKANGDFTDFDALTKVPGIDVEKLQKNKDAIGF
jgi:competence ComEA-like helix-hairpin-helix protein